ncbi:unnamed protein product [Larinioides sclopetarius]|uniref:Alpha-latrotoxin n=1 Tax=Larinioides sclopetarius TaxID=280406 RepID=A0AAV2ANQ5_9ARAC
MEWILDKGLDINSKDLNGQTILHVAAKFNGIQVIRYMVEQKRMSLDMSDANGKTPFHVAAENHSNEVLEYISNLGICRRMKDYNGYTPLLTAIYMCNIDGVKILLKKEENIEENKAYGNLTALHIATYEGNLALLEMLIKKKASVNSRSDIGETPLHSAVTSGNLETVKYLILNHADVNARTEFGVTPLLLAVERGIKEIVELLLKHKVNVNIPDSSKGFTPLHIAVQRSNKEIVELLLKHKAEVNVSDKRGGIPLLIASILGDAPIAKLLLQAGSRVNSKNDLESSPLHFAVNAGQYKIVELLLKHNADVDCKNNDNVTALHLSVLRSHKEITRLLIEKGADINAMNSTGYTPLHLAACIGQKDIVDLLIDNGADISCKNENGSSALHLSASNFVRDMVESLLKQGADIRETDIKREVFFDLLVYKGYLDLLTPEEEDICWADINSFTLLHVAALRGDLMLVQHYIENGYDTNARSICGETALHVAAFGNHPNIISFLLSKDMEIDARDVYGLTPLLLATKGNKSEAVKVLISHDVNCISNDKIEALQYSVESGNVHVVDILLQNYKFDICFKIKRKLLYTAVKKNHKHVVNILLKRGFEINGDSKPLHVAVRHSLYNMAELLLTKKANPNLLDKDKCTPLDISVKMRDAEMIEILLSEKANICIKRKFVLSAAESAVRTNQLDIIKLLLQLKAIKANTKFNSGYTFLHSAALSGSLDVTKYLVAEGADINAKDKKNRRPVHIAAEKGFNNLVEFYLNTNDYENELPELLLISASNGNADVCELLLERSVDVNVCRLNEESPLKSALVKGHKEVISVLLHYGAYYNRHPTTLLEQIDNNEAASRLRKVEKMFTFVKNNASTKIRTLLKEESVSKYSITNAKCEIKDSVLHYASSNGYKEIIYILLKHNTNPNARTKTGETPLHYAVRCSHFGIVNSLLSNGAMYNSISQAGKTPLDYATNSEIRNFFIFLNKIFTKVQKNDNSVLENLRGKDKITMRSIVRCKNQEGKSLIEVAMICGFLKTGELQVLFETELGHNLEHDFRSARTLMAEQRYSEAVLIFERALETRVKVFGRDSHPVTDVKLMLAAIFQVQGNMDKALQVFREVHKVRKIVYGEDHPQTLLVKTYIASSFSMQGKTEEALRIYETIRVKLKQKPEPDDLITITNERCIITELLKIQKFDKALKIIIEVEDKYSQQEQKFWFYFRQIRLCKALIYSMQGKYSEALELFTAEYESRKNILTYHPELTLQALLGVAEVLNKQRKHDESLEVWKKVLEIQKSHLPEGHIDILKSEFSIGEVLFRQSMLFTALKMFLSLEPRIAALGEDSDLMSSCKERIAAIKEICLKMRLYCVDELIQNFRQQNF